MSVKAQALVWDLDCPRQYENLMFKPSHKYVLIAYADHADHHGKNIWPSVPTISRKTGLDERSVQRLTRDLEEMGLLIEDGAGPRGTNKWKLPYNEGGDNLSPVTICRGDKNEKSLGDIPSGDIPSGDKLSPELKEPEPLNLEDNAIWNSVLELLKGDFGKGSHWDAYIRDSRVVRFDGNALTIGTSSPEACAWLADRVRRSAERALVGILNQEVSITFVAGEVS